MALQEKFEERNVEMFNLRYEEGWTLQKIGDKFGLTRERVRQITDEMLAELELL